MTGIETGSVKQALQGVADCFRGLEDYRHAQVCMCVRMYVVYVCVCVYVCAFVSVCICMCVCLCVCLCLCVCMYASVCMSVYVCV